MTDTIPAFSAPWNDSTKTPAERAAALLAAMTPREKLQQLGSTWPNAAGASGDVAPMQDTQLRAEPFDEAIADGIGHLTRPFGTLPIDPAIGMRQLARLQREVIAANRFGIPAIAHEECLTGLTAWRATVYPTPLAWGAAFDPTLVAAMAARIGADMAALGVHQGLSPVLDVVRDYRWGRVEETIGEDPYLVGETAAAYVRGLQSAGVIATLKHFAGYSASRGARNHAPVSMGSREFADVILPPFEKAVVQAGARSVMNSYTDVDGVPAAVDRDLLTGLLRDTWQFQGTVVSDYWAVPFVHSTHRVAADDLDAGAQTLEAGIDVELPHTLGYLPELLERVDPELVDRSALRVLTQKAELGLLDADWAPTEPGDLDLDLDSSENRDLARLLAERSLVLLANRGEVLPLASPPARVAVIGPGADDSGCLFGCYSFPNHVVPAHPGLDIGIAAPTVLDGIRTEFPEAEVDYVEGVPVLGGENEGIAAAASAARAADLTVLVIGDRSGMFGHGTSGEGCDVLDLELPGRQRELANAVLAAGRRVVLVVISGRPYAIGDLAARADATVQAFFPGEEGGPAIAGLLSGRVAPSGRLPVQIPGSMASQPGTYLAPPLALRSDGVSNLDPTPAFPFGFGLSTTTFSMEGAQLSATELAVDGTVMASVSVSNTGVRHGSHVVQLYLSDPVASVARPVRQLIGFARVDLAPGESTRVAFTVHADLTSFTGRDGVRRIEPGTAVLTLAESAADPGIPLAVEVIGELRHVDHTRALTTSVEVG
ncbi:glycoside hydrolase family 3 N-terminal domain-containing protein [Agromyces sp. MMS24-K17]|uniref:glycoside hydrolase family 3 N-terminal domain-containing protein n=1 Tax=Agromyces sp. MMS24-K17 TaxID=3372850 RepID=UPI0037551229